MNGTQDGPPIASAAAPPGSEPFDVVMAYAPYDEKGIANAKPIESISHPRVVLGRRLSTITPTVGKVKTMNENTGSPFPLETSINVPAMSPRTQTA